MCRLHRRRVDHKVVTCRLAARGRIPTPHSTEESQARALSEQEQWSESEDRGTEGGALEGEGQAERRHRLRPKLSARAVLARAQSQAQVDGAHKQQQQQLDIRVGYSAVEGVGGLIGRDHAKRARLQDAASGRHGGFTQHQARAELQELAACEGATYDALGFSHGLHATAPTGAPAGAPSARELPSALSRRQTPIRSSAAIRSTWPMGKPRPAPVRPQGHYAGQVFVPGALAPHFRRLV